MKRLIEVVNQTFPIGMVYRFRHSLPLHFGALAAINDTPGNPYGDRQTLVLNSSSLSD